jgi:hypothetical protein
LTRTRRPGISALHLILPADPRSITGRRRRTIRRAAANELTSEVG